MADYWTGECVTCDSNCDQCFGKGEDECISCKTGFFLVGNSCNHCQPTEYGNLVTQRCNPCFENCRTCRGT